MMGIELQSDQPEWVGQGEMFVADAPVQRTPLKTLFSHDV
jgi:hypothetical protein